MVRIRRFGIVRTANMVAALYAFLALIFIAIFGAFGVLGLAVAPRGTATGQLGAGIIGLLIIGVLIVLFYAVIGWIFTAILCAIYNLVAGWVGGVEIQLESAPGAPGGGYPAYGYPAAYGAPGGYPAPGAYPGSYPAPAQPGPAPAGGGNLPPPAPGG